MKTEAAILGGGCFWGVEEILRKIPSVLDTEVGYCGGSSQTATYQKVTKGNTGHVEVVRIQFDPQKISFVGLLEYFFRLHDPTTHDQQGNDIGSQYRSVIFFQSEEQRKVSDEVKKKIQESGKWRAEVVTEILPRMPFFSAEDYHQDYLQKNPDGYNCHYLRD